jgi:hypothetical protein
VEKMGQISINNPPNRVTDLVGLKKKNQQCHAVFPLKSCPLILRIMTIRFRRSYSFAVTKEEKQYRINIANERLKILYDEFDQASIKYEKRIF